MKTVNLQAAKTHRSRLVEDVLAGDDITLAKAGKPLGRLVPYRAEGLPRVGGQLKGVIWESDDCWDGVDELADAIGAPLDQGTAAAMTLPLKLAEVES